MQTCSCRLLLGVVYYTGLSGCKTGKVEGRSGLGLKAMQGCHSIRRVAWLLGLSCVLGATHVLAGAMLAACIPLLGDSRYSQPNNLLPTYQPNAQPGTPAMQRWPGRNNLPASGRQSAVSLPCSLTAAESPLCRHQWRLSFEARSSLSLCRQEQSLLCLLCCQVSSGVAVDSQQQQMVEAVACVVRGIWAVFVPAAKCHGQLHVVPVATEETNLDTHPCASRCVRSLWQGWLWQVCVACHARCRGPQVSVRFRTGWS